MTLNDAVKKLRGKPGTKVKITVLREDEFKLHDFTITREIIRIQDVKNVQILEENIGYIRLAEFREDSFKEFHKALKKLKEDGADSLILDLRNNPGGLLNVAIDITEEFIPENEIIVSTKGRRESQDTITKSKNKDPISWPVAVLINEGSASGSEILAGALKDNKRAIIVGAKSFGKGSVQSVIPLPDGSGIRLTTSKYFTPAGMSIHGIGIEPDINVPRIVQEVKEEEKNEEDHVEKVFENVELQNKPSAEELKMNKKDMETRKRILADDQVRSAINVIKGIKVFRKSQKQDPN
jgi:carboxyl-terminal processing protease